MIAKSTSIPPAPVAAADDPALTVRRRPRRKPSAAVLDQTLSGQQCAKARALLGWTAERLAAKGDVSAPTIRKLEAGQLVLLPKRKAIRAALEYAGISFSSGKVRLRNQKPAGDEVPHSGE